MALPEPFRLAAPVRHGSSANRRARAHLRGLNLIHLFLVEEAESGRYQARW